MESARNSVTRMVYGLGFQVCTVQRRRDAAMPGRAAHASTYNDFNDTTALARIVRGRCMAFGDRYVCTSAGACRRTCVERMCTAATAVEASRLMAGLAVLWPFECPGKEVGPSASCSLRHHHRRQQGEHLYSLTCQLTAGRCARVGEEAEQVGEEAVGVGVGSAQRADPTRRTAGIPPAARTILLSLSSTPTPNSPCGCRCVPLLPVLPGRRTSCHCQCSPPQTPSAAISFADTFEPSQHFACNRGRRL